MKRTLIRLGLTALISSALFGCGGGSDGVDGSNTVVQIKPSTPASTISSNATTPTSASVAAWRALDPKITVTGVTIASPPVVSFAVTDANGAAVVGLGNKSKASTATVSSLTNLSFTLAKLVPATASAPSKWVSYLVVKPTTVAQVGGTIASTESCTADMKWCGTYPTTDKEGALVDNGDGTYKYTFARDVTQIANVVAGLPNSGDGLKLKADLGDVSYDASATHRVGVIISGAAPGTGSNTPTATTVVPATNIAIAGNYVYDFVPNGSAVTATRSVVDIASCASCHNGKGLAHGGSRKDPNLCVTCHTDQIKYGMSGEASRTALTLTGITQNTTSVLEGRAIGNFPNFVHKIHMGAELKLSGYNFIPNSSGIGMNFNEVEWIQDPRNCTKCHNGTVNPLLNAADQQNVAKTTKDGDNWKNKPNMLACGACHDNISFAAAVPAGLTAHTGGVVTDGDASCASCHSAAGPAGGIDVAHRTEVQTANNPVQANGVANIAYEIKSVTVVSGLPVFKFRIVKDGAPVTAFNVPTMAVSSGATVVQSSPAFEPITGFKGGPTFYVAFAVPQDGITSPADFNAYFSVSLTNLLVASGSPKAGTLTGPDASGVWTATLTGDTLGQPVSATCTQKTTTAAGYCVNPSPIMIPASAKMVTGAMITNFTQLTFTSGDTVGLSAKFNPINGTVSKGLAIKTNLQKMVATGYTARRIAVDAAKCESCHEQLGTAVEFHGGARNDPTACAICHNTSKSSGGWSANASTFVHGIHAGTVTGSGGAGAAYSTGKRTIPFTWVRGADYNFPAVVYPGILKRCDNCHVPNAVNFGATGTTIQPNLLWSTSGTGTYTDDVAATYKVLPRNAAGVVQYVTPGTRYGNVFSFTSEGSVVPKITTSANTNNSDALTIAGAGGVTIPADAATLVESPITSACFACHDSAVGQAHMVANGGTIYGPRAASLAKPVETCLICHGMGRDQDAAAVHAK